MRQTVRSAGLLSLFLLNLTTLSAEPLLRGFFIGQLPQGSNSQQLAPGKGLVLAHVFNSGDEAIRSGNYQIGVEIDSAGKKRSYALKPGDNIAAGVLKTFRMAVPVKEDEKKTATFRVFSNIDGKTIWSDKFLFVQGVQSVQTAGKSKITTLYTEAPPEPSSVKPPKEIPFENEKTAQKVAALEKAVKPVNTLSSGKGSAPVKAPAAAESVKVEPAVPTRQIDMSEFKKLRTIDEELVIYVIKQGDTLKSIAEKYYGQATKERTIADLNFIEKPSSIKVGEEIIVDVKPLGKSEQVTSSLAKTGRLPDPAMNGAKTYTVQKGDTLGKIAREHLGSSGSNSVNSLMKANPGLNARNLKIGEIIVIPDNKGDNA
ncbi:MAG: LysM domain-containing protein [Candidatus Riflebacteria bacterium]|nr:LysM domain-containing protein [Candidatus Riflebacteria bacterium]